MAYYKKLTDYLNADRQPLTGLDRMILGNVRRIDIPLHTDHQMKKSGKLLVELGERLQMISRYNWMERTKLWHCRDAISMTRELLKREIPKKKSTS